jgi:hypothetical protein
MAIEQNAAVVISRKAEADLSALQYTFVKAGSSGGVAAQASQGGDALGVLQNKPTSGKTAVILTFGISKLLMGGVVADGGDIATGTAGAGEDSAASDYVLGKSLHGANSASSDIITAAINCISNHLHPA